ncbi:MAG: sugar kinase [Ginsengibacter sp.]
MHKKIVCFGELLLRMSPGTHGEWLRDANIPLYLGGSELNVATALSNWKLPVQYLTALPDHALSKDICDHLVKKRIDISNVVFSGSRIGIYYLARGSDLKHHGVIYDRQHSSFSELQPATIDWDEILNGVNWFHFSAITPALNDNIAAVCKEALMAAEKKGLIISVDLNHRSKLWQYGKQPVDVMTPLVQHCDVIMGNIWSANSLLAIGLDENIHEKKSKDAYLLHASKTAGALMKLFPKCKSVANTFRFDDLTSLKYYAALDDKTGQYVSKEFNTTEVSDKAGSGDCFMAGLIYGFTRQHPLQHVIDFAAAAAFGKLHEVGDATLQTVEDVELKLKPHG